MLLEFSKRGHRFAFVYNDQTAKQVIAILWKFAADPDLPITEDDAAELARATSARKGAEDDEQRTSNIQNDSAIPELQVW